ncbi:MAG TPA: PaaI family thioesterase [Acidimicrobiia bacterium]|nr:PaaI family thioesterase [Acidimicrobiia bacterium]
MTPPDPDALALLDATRDLADRVWRSQASPAARAAVAAEVARLVAQLGPFDEEAPVRTELGGALPGRGHPLLPPMVHGGDGRRRIGTVTYTRAHAGAGDAVHGGQVTLLFDEMLGGVAGTAAASRTASLTVHYRSLTPMGTELAVEGWVDRVEGRKIYVRGRLLDGDRVCAEAEGLFVAVDDWS